MELRRAPGRATSWSDRAVIHRAIAYACSHPFAGYGPCHHRGEKSGNLYRLLARDLFDFYLAIMRHELANLYHNFKAKKDGCVKVVFHPAA